MSFVLSLRALLKLTNRRASHLQPCIYVLNKIDQITIEELDLLYRIPNSVPISSRMWLNVDDELVERMWTELKLVRVYTKPRKQAPDYSQPVVLRQGKCSIEDFANAIHKECVSQIGCTLSHHLARLAEKSRPFRLTASFPNSA